jgi:FkbM family methyltransferase
MLKLYELLQKTKVGKMLIRLIKFILFLTPFGVRLEASIANAMTRKEQFGKIEFRGQCLQDAIAYLYLKQKENGFYIDIGANDGIVGSNTYIFEQIGWKGVCIEPQPDIFKRLTYFRKCDCYNVALSSVSDEKLEFIKVNDMNGLSGFSEWLTDDHKKTINESGNAETINVTTKTFDDIMKNYPDTTVIDFLSIDVEGYELNILRTIDFTKYSFGIITVESNGNENEISDLMTKNGYKYLMDAGCDIMFVPN